MSSRPGHARRRDLAPVALVVVLCLLPGLLAACGARGPASQASGAPVSAAGADASRSPGAELQAGTTHLLVERTHVTAAARDAAGEAERADALRALDEIAVALAELLGAAAPDGREALLAALRTCDRRTVAHSGADDATLTAALDELGVALQRVAPRLPASLLRERLADDLAAQLAVGGDDPYALLDDAATRAPGTARLLADSIVKDRRLGPVGARAATLRAELTAALTGHVMLAGAVAREGARSDGTVGLRTGAARASAVRASAVRALEADGDRLADLLGEAYPALREPFRESWAGHVRRVVTLAERGGGLEQRALLAYSPRLGMLLSRHVGGLPAATAAVEVGPLLSTLAQAVIASAAASPDAHAALRRATATVPAVAALLAAAIAEDRRYA